VPRDFVEFPSQFNEHWALDPKVFAHYAKHHQTGEPIPAELMEKVLAARGFNQAQEIARPLARALRLPLATGSCVRVRDTAPQSGLAPADRRDNMRGAFAVTQRRAVDGKHVLLIDDVMTTGHTLGALAACLKRHGAASVTNLVFARTPPH